MRLKKKPTIELVADELLREFSETRDQSYDVVAEMVSRRFSDRVSEDMMGRGIFLLTEKGFLECHQYADKKRYNVSVAGMGHLRAKLNSNLMTVRWAIGAVIALLAVAATIWAAW